MILRALKWLVKVLDKTPRPRELEFTYKFSLLNIETSYNVGFAKGRLQGAEEMTSLFMLMLHSDQDMQHTALNLKMNVEMLREATKDIVTKTIDQRVVKEKKLIEENFIVRHPRKEALENSKR
jgi:hypothetical protein